jgi:hypothetical protein
LASYLPVTVTDPFVVVRLTMALPVPMVPVVWFVSWTPSPELETVPFVVFGVILQEARAGSVRLTFPFVEVTM